MMLEPGTSRDVPRAGSALRRYLPHLALLLLLQTSESLGFVAPYGEMCAADRLSADAGPMSRYRAEWLLVCPIVAMLEVDSTNPVSGA